MIEYQGQINLPNPNFGTTEKTITANEVVRTCDTKALAKEVAHQSHDLITEGIAEMVINNFCKACVEKMVEGFAIQLQNEGDIAVRIFPDIHIKGDNINLKRAKELMPGVVTDEDTMVAHAGELIDKAGLKVSVRAIVQRKFTELLEKEGYQLKRLGIVTATAAQQNQQAADDQGGSEQEQEQQTGNLLTIQKTGSGTVNVTDQSNHQIDSGDDVQAGQTVRLSVTPSGSATPTATLDGQSVTLMEDEGQYVGTFQMPAQSATLVVNTGE